MSADPDRGCAVCGLHENRGGGMSRVVVEGRSLELCLSHATVVAAARPVTFEQMRDLFMGAVVDVDTMIRLDTPVERRSPIGRRAAEDRRLLPPRPEGRRMGGGRRAGDPRE